MDIVNHLIVYVVIVHLLINLGQCETVYTNKFIFKHFSDDDLRFVEEAALKSDLHLLEQILPTLYVFEHRALPSKYVDGKYLEKLKHTFNNKVDFIEQVIDRYELNTEEIPDGNRPRYVRDVSHNEDEQYSYSDGTCYEMGIEETWTEGHTGEGVVVGVLDVGVDKDIPDLKDKINDSLSYNFVHNNSIYAPEIFGSYLDTSLHLTDHGNRCSGLIAAIRKNNICTAGVAYYATIAALKVFEVEQKNFEFSRRFNTISMTRGLNFQKHEIHIYSNSWGALEHFAELKKAPLIAIENGAKEGRNSKGSIYVFPAGPLADAFANSVYTIAVNSIGTHGRIPSYTNSCACALTSVYGDGNTLTSTYMNTTSSRSGCTTEFKGVSASTALVSGIIALALEKRPDLSWRDVQYLAVAASVHECLKETNKFKKNGAGYHYHPVFGFGLLDASKLVALAEDWKHVPEQTIVKYERIPLSKLGHQAKVNIECNDDTCLETVEHVVASISFNTHFENNTEILLVSPMKTISTLMAYNQSSSTTSTKRENVHFLSVNFWGENPNGVWTVEMVQHGNPQGKFKLSSVSLTLYGIGHKKYERISGKIKPRDKQPNVDSFDHQTDVYFVLLAIVMLIISCFPCIHTILSHRRN